MSNAIVEEFYSMEYGPAPEDTKEVDRWLDAHKRSFGHYIDGAWQKPASGEYFATNNPATGDKIADVAQADRDKLSKPEEEDGIKIPDTSLSPPPAKSQGGVKP